MRRRTPCDEPTDNEKQRTHGWPTPEYAAWLRNKYHMIHMIVEVNVRRVVIWRGANLGLQKPKLL